MSFKAEVNVNLTFGLCIQHALINKQVLGNVSNSEYNTRKNAEVLPLCSMDMEDCGELKVSSFN